MTSRVLITGTNGVLGQATAAALLREGHVIIKHRGRVDGDLRDPAEVNRIIGESAPSAVVNAAGQTYGNPSELWDKNVLLPLRIGEALARRHTHTRLVLLSSAAVYGLRTAPGPAFREDEAPAPNSDYGWGKLAMERLVPLVHSRCVVARIFNIADADGDARALLARVRSDYADGVTKPPGAGSVRDWLTAVDIGHALACLATAKDPPTVLNVCSGAGRTAAEILGYPAPAPEPAWSIGDPGRMQAACPKWRPTPGA